MHVILTQGQNVLMETLRPGIDVLRIIFYLSNAIRILTCKYFETLEISRDNNYPLCKFTKAESFTLA